jgi:sialic acid synthase SpsE
LEIIRRIASKGKPVLLATGASNIGEVQRAVQAVLEVNSELVLMQCNTNYTASLENFDHIHLNVLKTYAAMWPQVVLGLSDHTRACHRARGGRPGRPGGGEALHRRHHSSRAGSSLLDGSAWLA